MDADRLSELQCLDPGDEFADDARVSITIRDLRDLTSLVDVAQAALAWADHETDADAKLLSAVRTLKECK